ncbi:MAG: hypothetical protein HRT82_13965 [Henriciella sp.]|nr:hypothetical protein [Henriciella sp.]
MPLLIVNALAPVPAGLQRDTITDRICDLIRRARLAGVSIGHLHQGHGGATTVLPIPIGRYDPVFKTQDLRGDFPKGLIEFLVGGPSRVIHLAGAARPGQLEHLSKLLASAGMQAKLIDAASIVLDEESMA